MVEFLKKLFHRSVEDKKPAKVKTAPLDASDLTSVSVTTVKMQPPQFIVGTGQSIGLQRDHNEDTLFASSSILTDGVNETQFGLFLIADGMGGYEFGEVASSMAARAASGHILEKIFLPQIIPDGVLPEESVHEIVEASIMKAQQLVKKRAPGGGTTLTAAIIIGDQVTIGHVGDSRAYFIHPDGRMELLTQDHSLVHRLVELGQITEEEALVHPNRNVLYRALGQPEPLNPDLHSYSMPHPGYLLLCSDGLWGSIGDNEIFQIVKNASSPSIACKNLVDTANGAGGVDNISVILVHYL